MKIPQIELLERLVLTPSPSGHEEEIAYFIEHELLEFLPKGQITKDRYHNVVVVLPGSSDKTVMIDAHMDQIGFIVTNIDRKGFISLQYIGGGDRSILSARDLVILTESGEVNAVVNRKHAHLVGDESDVGVDSMHEAAVDIGPRDREKVQSYVQIGDPVVYTPSFRHLRENFYAGTGMDDATGCLVLLETIKRIVKGRKTKSVPTLIFVFSAQEETYGKKCRPLIKKFNPDLVVEVDVTFATDWEDDDDLEREIGKCELGFGPVLYRGVEIDSGCFKLLNSVAKKSKICVQYQASPGSIGYTSTELTHEQLGIRALILGIPLRNMHTPVETIHLRDLDLSIRLLVNFLRDTHMKRVLSR